MFNHQYHARAQAAERRQRFESEASLRRLRDEIQRARNDERRHRNWYHRSAFRLRLRNA
jgi:hypothetical protein